MANHSRTQGKMPILSKQITKYLIFTKLINIIHHTAYHYIKFFDMDSLLFIHNFSKRPNN